MNERDAERVKELFRGVNGLAPEERTPYLDEACRNDPPHIRREVEELLAQRNPGGLLGNVWDDSTEYAAPSGPQPKIAGYRLLQRIGTGGMGEVWMADQTAPIRRRVALKLIKAGGDTRALVARFKVEMQALAAMTHANIARVFDAGTTDQGTPFFAMEYVPGVPITQYCDRHRLSIEERLDLFLQLCRGLQHAHDKGVVHRDIKPSNILVSASGDAPELKIIDFGLAKALGKPLTDETLVTEFGQVLGTPEYMSPEQADSSEEGVDARSDIYSLGAVLYELLVGVRPFNLNARGLESLDAMRRVICEEDPSRPSARITDLGDDASAVAERRRTEPTSLARELRDDIDWIILKAMEKDRTRRYQTARQLVEDIQRHLNGEPILAGAPGMIYRARKLLRRRSWLRSALIAILVAVLLVGALEVVRQFVSVDAEDQDVVAAVTIRPSIAVLDFDGPPDAASGAWASGAIADLLTEQFSMDSIVRVVDRELILARSSGLSIPDAERSDLQRLGVSLAADTIVSGEVSLEGSLVRVRARAWNAKTGRMLGETSYKTGNTFLLANVANQLGDTFRPVLGMPVLTPREEALFLGSYPDGEAAIPFFRGLDMLQRGELWEAESLFGEALKSAGHSRLLWQTGRTLKELYDPGDPAVLDAVAQAVELMMQLPPDERLLLQAFQATLEEGWESAAERYRELVARHPDDPAYALKLAEAEIRSGRPQDAYDSVARLQELAAPFSDDPRIDLIQARAAHALRNYDEALTRAQAAASRAGVYSDGLLVAWARFVEASIFADQGRALEAERSNNLALEGFREHGETVGVQKALENRAIRLWDEGRLVAADASYTLVIANYRRLKYGVSAGAALLNFASIRTDRGRLEESVAFLEEAKRLLTGERDYDGGATFHIGVNRFLQGKLDEARRLYEEALAAFIKNEFDVYWAAALSNLGELALVNGDLQTARNRNSDALETYQRYDPENEAFDSYQLGRTAAIAGDYSQAREHFTAAANAAVLPLDSARVLVGIAELNLLESNLDSADASARAAVATYVGAGAADWAAIARSVLATARLAAGDLEEAQALNIEVRARALESSDFRVRFRSPLLEARIAASGGNPTGALEELERVRELAEAGGFKLFEYEARLASLAIEMNIARSPATEAKRQTLIADASRDGLAQYRIRAEAL